ncbi:hypothetical protein N7495_008947 [Penicillium taxi]|uniref:uncharacterized protein n=1 Tax=Penicillium taxi TaxID=168475 RepID=UPI00254589F7|nr:uncharacterized protein N7495_008947 [Penicillium taxi]KAJ5888906.1 hypothetical protein N7495_008947 [Penicillium taxi]
MKWPLDRMRPVGAKVQLSIPSQAKRRSGIIFKGPSSNDRYIELEEQDLLRTSSPMNETPHHDTQKRRMLYIPDTWYSRSFALIGIIETILTVAIESWIFVSISKHFDAFGNTQGTLRLRSFLALYIFALLYELVLAYDALRRKNAFQLVGLCCCNLGLFAYGIVQTHEVRETMLSLAVDVSESAHLWRLYRIGLIVVPVLLGIATIAMSFVTWKLRAEFAWYIYKDISADLQMNRHYFIYQVYIALLKFDFFFIFGSQLQILLAIKSSRNFDFIIEAVMIPIGILTLVLAARFCRMEKTKSLFVVMSFMCVIIASFILSLYETFNTNSSIKVYQVSLTLLTTIAILLIVATLVNSVLCIRGFNKGLKQHIESLRKTQPTHEGDNWDQDTKSRFEIN